MTLSGRIMAPFVMGRYQAGRCTAARGQCDLVRRKDGKWFLLVTVDRLTAMGSATLARILRNVACATTICAVVCKHRQPAGNGAAGTPGVFGVRSALSQCPLPKPKAPGADLPWRLSRASATGHGFASRNGPGWAGGLSTGFAPLSGARHSRQGLMLLLSIHATRAGSARFADLPPGPTAHRHQSSAVWGLWTHGPR